MASIGNDPNGRKRILFVAGDGSRKTIRLGKCDQRTAEGICRHVENLLCSRISNQPIPRGTAVWLGEIGDTLHDRLARAGLVDPRAAAPVVKLDAFIESYLAQRTDVKPATMAIMQQCRRHMVNTLGDVPLTAITPADGDTFRAAMLSRGCARSTLHKWQRYARHFLEVARRRKLIPENPFSHLKGMVKGDPARRVFVPAEDVNRVIDVAPDNQWKLLIALARFGGLRIPSEALALKWSDVDWERARFVVRAPKTEHHGDGGVRITPLFPELAPLFQTVFDEAEPGEEYVITRYRNPAVNLRTQLVRYIVAAGLRPWPKPWQNLRASRATELADQYPSHVAAAWLGHSEGIADSFYRQVTEDHFQKAAQNPAQYEQESAGTERKAEQAKPQNVPVLPPHSACNCSLHKGLLGDTGLEPVASCMSSKRSSQLS